MHNMSTTTGNFGADIQSIFWGRVPVQSGSTSKILAIAVDVGLCLGLADHLSRWHAGSLGLTH